MANAISTLRSHVSRALDFYNKDDVYFCIGRSTAWPDDTTPPAPDPNTVDLDEIIGFKKVETKHLVVPDESGSIVYRNTKWLIVPEANALSQGAKWVYIKTTIAYDELPLGFYRQIGVYSGLVVDANVPEGQFNLLPSEVESHGILETLDNRTPGYRSSDSQDILQLVIQF